MDKETGQITYRAEQIGEKAKDLLADEFCGKVLAALPATVYLQAQDGEIVWLVGRGVPAHRRYIFLPFPLRFAGAGERIVLNGTRLHVGKASIQFNCAGEWGPPVIGKIIPLPDLNALLLQLFSALNNMQTPQGLGQSIPDVAALAEGREIHFSPSDPLMARALEPILALARAGLCRNMGRMAETARDLVGLGPGLTPSGDDFVGGMLFAAQTLQDAYPQEFCREERPVLEFLNWARSQTNSISFALLSDLASGHGPEPLHELSAMLLDGRNPDSMMPAIRRVLGIGHTSGWDLLSGFITGMLPVVGRTKHFH